DGDGSQGRLPSPGRGQAEPARRAAAGGCRERRRGGEVTAGCARHAARRPIARATVAVGAAALLGGCAWFGSLFGPDRPKPKELEPIAAPMAVRPAWNQSI